MFLSVPLTAPFTSLRAGSDLFGASVVDARQRVQSARPCEPGHHRRAQQSGQALSVPPVGRRGLVVHAGGKDAAGGLPASSREAAERRRVLLKYVREVQPALIEEFVERGPPAVVAAMKNTITNMLGTLPPQFFTVTISTVGENMSQLMLSVMMTGYLFRNAQYRLELRNALGGAAKPGGMAVQSVPGSTTSSGSSSSSSSVGLRASNGSGGSSSGGGGGGSRMQRCVSAPVQGSVLDDETYAPGVQKSRVQGDVLLWHKENGLETLEAVQYIGVLEDEVTRLRAQLQQLQAAPHAQRHAQQQHQLPPPHLPQQQQQQPQPAAGGQPGVPAADGRPLPAPVSSHNSLQQSPPSAAAAAAASALTASSGPAGVLSLHDEPLPNELLDYLRALDTGSLAELTRGAGAEVGAAMESFVGRLMGTRDRDSLSRAGSDCSAQELARVMFWLMVVGYTLRGLEVRWDMQRAALADVSRAGDARLSCDDGHEAW